MSRRALVDTTLVRVPVGLVPGGRVGSDDTHPVILVLDNIDIAVCVCGVERLFGRRGRLRLRGGLARRRRLVRGLTSEQRKKKQ